MSVGNFAILAFVDPIGIVTTPSGMEIFESQVHGSLSWTQIVHSDISRRSGLLSCELLALPWLGEPRVGMTPILVILAS